MEAAATAQHRRVYGADYQTPGGEDDVIQIDSPNTFYQLPPQSSGMGTLAKLAIAGLAASGIGLPVGLGLALPAILDYLKPSPPAAVPEPEKPAETPPVVVPPAGVDTDTWFDLRLEK